MADGSALETTPATQQTPPVLARLVSAGVEDALKRFGDPVLLAAGKVNIISLEAIEAHLGPRWELRKDQVYDFTRRVLERGVGAAGFFTRVSSTDFFVVQPELGRLAGQATCLHYLREVLQHFLGEHQMAGKGVLQVTQVVDGQILATCMDDRAHAYSPGSAEESEAGGVEIVRSTNTWTPFVAADGRPLRVTATLEPVYELKGFTRIGFRMIRRVIVVRTEEELSPQQIAMLSTADLLRVDLATIVRGIDRLQSESRSERQLSLIVPLSFTSLSSFKGRSEFVKQLKEANHLVKLGVICEISDVDGVPPGALLAAASLLRPFALLVVGRLLNTEPAAIVRMEGSGLQAVSFESPRGLADAEFHRWAEFSIRAARRVAKSVLVYRANSPQQAAVLASLGASHASFVPA